MSDEPIAAQVDTNSKVSSALTPALVLAASSIAGGVAGLRIGPEDYQQYCVFLMLAGPALAALQIIFFTFADRDRLHSERHIEKKMIISRLRPQIGDARSVVEIDGDSQLIENPRARGQGDV
ncbi:hypothetical protein [Sphingopyxis sp. L1A2A]|uniref:hypothetical protein n=1 Tax=Sphingopyxis sp. L1A2A TaxID=2502247 RepID=UPI0010F43676|nr:hypothetical protein [Sphingopyxis sp. L1A2A]